MSDQKRWFKVWATILTDPSHTELTLEDVGRWTRLGALIASVGNNGSVTLKSPYRNFLLLMDCVTIEDATKCLKRLPNVEAKTVYGEITVTMLKWLYYQIDSTSAERMKTLRSKRREEKRRVESPKTLLDSSSLVEQKGAVAAPAPTPLPDAPASATASLPPAEPASGEKESNALLRNVRKVFAPGDEVDPEGFAEHLRKWRKSEASSRTKAQGPEDEPTPPEQLQAVDMPSGKPGGW